MAEQARWIYIDGKGQAHINGEKKYSFTIPHEWNIGDLEYAFKEACLKYNVEIPEDDEELHRILAAAVRSFSKKVTEANEAKTRTDPSRNETKNEGIICEIVIEKGDEIKRSLILSANRFYMHELRLRHDDWIQSQSEITLRPPILKKKIKINGKELLVVSYLPNEVIGDVHEVVRAIERIGGVVSRNYRTALSTIIEAQRASVDTEVAYPCVGILTNPELQKLTLALPQLNNVYLTELKENEGANEITREIYKRALPDHAQLKTGLSGYISLDAYVKPLEIVPVIGYAAIIPFAYELKALEKGDYFCHVLLHGPKDLGKSTIANIATDDLYGVLPKGVDYIDSKFRMLQTLNATTAPQHIAEMETFDFDEFADTIKNATDIPKVGSRGNADQTMNNYDGKSILFYSANSYKASKSALTTRIIMIPAQNDPGVIKAKKQQFAAFVRHRTKARPIGFSLLQYIVAEYPTAVALYEAIKKTRSEIMYNIRRPEIDIGLTDSRRSLTYALMLFGVRSWQRFIQSIFPKLSGRDHSERWFNKYSNVELFIEDIVRPLESLSGEILRQNPTAAFIAWLESFISNQGSKEEGYTWMHAKRGDYIYVTAGVLETYKKHCKQAGGAPFESLPQLATELRAYTGEDCKSYSTDIGRDADPDTGKLAVPYKNRAVVRVPMSPQSKLTATLQATN